MRMFVFIFLINSISSHAINSYHWLNENATDLTNMEGDVLREASSTQFDQYSSGEHAAVTISSTKVWDNKIVPYNMSRNFKPKQLSIIYSAISEIEDHSCVRFTSRSNEKDYIYFNLMDRNGVCATHVGQVGYKQYVNLTSECVTRNTVIHELAHVLGFHHEHNRHDRDKYIKVLMHNVDPNRISQFVRRSYNEHNGFNFSYDPKSISHYPEYAFSSYGERTIVPIPYWITIMADGLSELDKRKLNLLYDCRDFLLQGAHGEENEEDNFGSVISTLPMIKPLPVKSLSEELVENAKSGNSELVLQYLNNGGDANARYEKEMSKTLLHIAAEYDDLNLLQILVINGSAKTEEKDVHGFGPLHYAAAHGSANATSFLLVHNASAKSRNDKNIMPQHIAAKSGHADIISLLVNSSIDIEENDSDGWTMVHYAAANGHTNVIAFLFELSATMETRDKHGRTPLHLAAASGNTETVSFLLNRSSTNIETKDDLGMTALHHASENPNGHGNIVLILLNNSAKKFAKDNKGWTPLHYAASKGYKNLVYVLVANTKMVDLKDFDSRTPLHLAAQFGHANIATFLLNNSATIDAKAKYKWTPLHYASEFGQTIMVSILIKNGADVFAKANLPNDPLNRTPHVTALDLAKRLNHTDIIHILETRQRQLTFK